MKLSSFFLLVTLGFVACNNSQPAQQAASQTDTTNPKDHSRWLASIDSLAQTVKAQIGVAAVNITTGDSFSYHGSDSFAMFSTYKFPLALYILNQEEEGKLKITDPVTIRKQAFDTYHGGKFIEQYSPGDITLPVDSLIWYAMAYSDNITTDHLFRLVGGPAAVNEFIHAKGVEDIAIRNTVLEMGRDRLYSKNWCTPIAMTQLLRLFDEGDIINETHKAYLLRYMELAPSGSNRIKALLPEGTIVAHKTGTGGTNDGTTDAVNDVGIISLPNGQRLALSVYINKLAGNVEDGERITAQIAKMVYEEAIR